MPSKMADVASRQQLAERAEQAAVAPRQKVEAFFKETAKEVLMALARNPNLRENDLLRLLERKDLPQDVVSQISEHQEAEKSYAIRLALVRHPKAPRLVSLPLMKFLFLFDLVRVSQTPSVPTDVKLAAEEAVLKKVEALPQGEKLTLARRGSGRIAAGLIVSDDPQLVSAALDNPFLTEGDLLKVLSLEDLPRRVVEALANHSKWSTRYYLRLSLLRNPHTPRERVVAFLPDLAVNDLKDICLDRRMPEEVRSYIQAHCADRLAKKPRNH